MIHIHDIRKNLICIYFQHTFTGAATIIYTSFNQPCQSIAIFCFEFQVTFNHITHNLLPFSWNHHHHFVSSECILIPLINLVSME